MRIAVFSTYDISPGQNGGEIRFQNLYRRLSRSNDVRILSYDFFSSSPLYYSRIEPNLEIITAGISDGDRSVFLAANDQTGLYLHDVLCISKYQFTKQFLAEMDSALQWADVAIVTTPFLSNLVFPRCTRSHLKIYESHNVEYRAKTAFFRASLDIDFTEKLINDTIYCERFALEEADIVITVSSEDAVSFQKDFDALPQKIRSVPNGVDVGSFEKISVDAKLAFRKSARLDGIDVGIFIGSAYGPNVDSYRLTRLWLERAGFTGVILVLGRISESFDSTWPRVNFSEQWLGFVNDTEKQLLISSADFALQIVMSGGGTNLKLFDYMAAGVPILANTFGARGVREDGWYIRVDSEEEMNSVVRTRAWASEAAGAAANAAQKIARENFDWDVIAKQYEAILA